MPNYAELAEPFTELLMKNQPFVWGAELDLCSDEQKRTLMSAPVLAHLDPHRYVEIHTDASAVGVGAVLVQKDDDGELLVANKSRALRKAQKSSGATELELFADVIAVVKSFTTI